MKYSSYIINKFILYGLAMLALGAFFVLNFYVPFYADDYCRTKESFDLYQITSDATSDYFNWTGRWPVMFLNRVFFSFGQSKPLFSLCFLNLDGQNQYFHCVF